MIVRTTRPQPKPEEQRTPLYRPQPDTTLFQGWGPKF